ncbi:uncharacterized protein LOC141850186 [Brevipalpus obovatus]|uniref:uncharacterized protein LOC141850186 n=1 Tax=Brevipalpus obovatus TaxID=246614 RepID=UPI003D9DEFC5
MDTLVDGDDAVVTSSGDRREASESSNDDGISDGSSVVVTSCRKDLDHLSSGNNLSSSPSSSSSTSIFLPNSLRTTSNSVGGGGGGVGINSNHNQNRTVVFTSISPSTTSTAIPGTLKHHHHHQQQQISQSQSQTIVNSHHGMSTQAIAVPQPGGGVSIVQVQLSANQVPNTIQSVIQPAHQQSVIQATGGAAASLQALQIPKNVIFLNKVAQNSVIQSTDHQTDMNQVLISGFDRHDNTSPSDLHTGSSDSVITPPPPPSTTTTSTIITPVQQTSTILPSSSITGSTSTPEDESKKRREALERRPSYRKILNELSSADVGAITSLPSIKNEDDNDSESSTTTIVTGVSSPYLKVVPGSTIQLAAAAQDGLQGLQTLNMTNTSGGGNTIVQYAAQGQDGQFFVPVTVSAAELQAYQIRAGTGSAQGLAQGVVMTAHNTIASPHHPEDTTKKRELRLLKNREAAKECRRKKKEYIKCLEQRVNVLENQNKALIEELKTLKNLYCQKE